MNVHWSSWRWAPEPERRQGASKGPRIVGLALAVSLLVACAPASSPAPTAAPATAKPAAPTAAAKPADPSKPAEAAKPAAVAKVEPKGTVTLVMPEEPRSLSSFEAYATVGYPVLRNVHEALVNRDPKTSELVGELASGWEQVNPTTWRFHLRPGVKFHDGSPFNAEAAAFGLDYTFKKENGFAIRTRLGSELTFKAIDENTLEVVAEKPDPILPVRMYFAPIPSMKALQESPADYPLKPIGTGPYKFVEWVKGQHIKITANPDWWGNGSPDARGAATIKDAVFLTRVEREVRTAMVKQGEADLVRWLTKEQCAEAPQCLTAPGVETIFVRIDQPNPALADKRVREAIALAIDKNALINDIMGGGAIASMMVGPSAVGYNPDLRPYPYDPARAKALISEAKAAGVPVDTQLQMVARRGAYLRIEEASEAATEMLKQAGLPNIRTQVLETAAHLEMWSIGKVPPPERGMLGMHSHGNEIMDYGQTINAYYTCNGVQSAYCNPAVDEAFQKATALGGAERQKAFADIAKMVYDDYATVPIGQPEFSFGLTKRLNWAQRADGFILLKEMTLNE
jgi:peptide/nickel transport system substrate-binding protein